MPDPKRKASNKKPTAKKKATNGPAKAPKDKANDKKEPKRVSCAKLPNLEWFNFIRTDIHMLGTILLRSWMSRF